MSVESTWILVYCGVVLVLAFLAAWLLDRRDNAIDDAERWRRHLQSRDGRQDTYLDVQGRQQ